MLQDHLLTILALLFVTCMLALVSERLRVSYPVLLVLAGLLIGFVPYVPAVHMDPHLILLVFLPPLLYAAAWTTSWADFWRLRRPIGLLAFGLVIFTATIIAFFSHWLIPGFPLALGFLLGAIISPPDAVAASSVFQNLKVPKTVVAILEGESLINDASSLIVFRFALASLLTGNFVVWDAATGFLSVVSFGILIGLAIAYVLYLIHRFLPTTPIIDTALTLISPYLMYLTAEHFGYSGVLAVVSGGLFLSFRSNDIFSFNARLQGDTVWNVIVFLLNGVVFILIGLQLPEIINGLGNYLISECIYFAVWISLVAIVIRLIWVYMVTYLPLIVWPQRAGGNTANWKSTFIVGWSGMRGVVSLASALALPLTLADGRAFPHRSLILFITFVVILFTLILQGLSLPGILKLMKLEIKEDAAFLENKISNRLALAVVHYLNDHYPRELATNPLFARVKARYQQVADTADRELSATEISQHELETNQQMLLDIISVRRQKLKQMQKCRTYPDELLRAKQRELDIEEAGVRKT